MKHEVKDEKAGSGFVNDVEKGDDFVATDAETVKVDQANDEEGKLTFTRPLQNLGSRLYLVVLFRLPRVVFGWEGLGNGGLVRSETFEPEELLPLKSQSKIHSARHFWSLTVCLELRSCIPLPDKKMAATVCLPYQVHC
ncbi:hypothetical protein NC653_000260 [Populus alba x Populus x berolinensis]|uniref:Uncharacterized protein n=1 Tax=Populus alba x Populus x berolinensis TaxID=444605 RepID=A0AAD6RIN5_9ROSI|nr:hypothetical protein NC653_000260 [Populus alba x Populus x berolinensis]